MLLLGHRQAFAWVDEWIGRFFYSHAVHTLVLIYSRWHISTFQLSTIH